jgi:hypothetical protein
VTALLGDYTMFYLLVVYEFLGLVEEITQKKDKIFFKTLSFLGDLYYNNRRFMVSRYL